MDKEKNEFLGLLCNLYLIALLVVLPLYTGEEGYWKLGDTKYELFRNVSLLCLGCWLVLGMPRRIRAVWERLGMIRDGRKRSLGEWKADTAGQEMSAGKRKRDAAGRSAVSIVDLAVAAYGLCAAISALCSSYGQLAWIGYNEWYMGAISQLIFVGIYFFVSRQYDGAAFPLYLGEAAVFLVTLFGLLHRLGIDPLGLQTGWNSGDWEYNHMLSTLGNINWLCGFYSVALAFVLTHYLREERIWLQIPLYVTVTASFVLLGVQGSQGGRLILAVGTAACILAGWRHKAVLRKLFLMLTGFFLCMPLMELLTKLRGKKAAVAADGDVFEYVEWYGWVIAAAACLVFFFILGRRVRNAAQTASGCDTAGNLSHGRRGGKFEGNVLSGHERMPDEAEKGCKHGKKEGESFIPSEGEKKGRRWFLAGIAGVCIVLVGVLLCDRMQTQRTVSQGTASGENAFFGIDDSFGSGRGFLWRIALEGFGQADVRDKLLGAGPDCYGEAVFQRLGAGTDVWKGEHWEGAVFTNAHNEILSQLINVGILGTICYAAIFLTGLWRYCGSFLREQKSCPGGERAEYVRWMGLLAIAMYGAHSLISFQQVLNTPLLFTALGLCECGMRGQKFR